MRLRLGDKKEIEGEHLFVDIANFKLELRDGDENRLDMKIVVGDKDWQTPVFDSKISHLVLNPSWWIPIWKIPTISLRIRPTS